VSKVHDSTQGIIVEAGLLLPLHYHPSNAQMSISRIFTGFCDRVSIPMTTSAMRCKLRRFFMPILLRGLGNR